MLGFSVECNSLIVKLINTCIVSLLLATSNVGSLLQRQIHV